MKLDEVSIGVWRYDRTQPLYDGRVQSKDRRFIMVEAPLEELFSKAFSTAEYEVSELSLSNFLRARIDGSCAYLAIPVFPSRAFRHGAFYIRSDSGLRDPRDLVGCRVGVREYSMTAALAARGALRDQFGIEADQLNWITGDVNERERDEIILPKLHRDISLTVAPDGRFLDDMLVAGEIDAILAYKPIKSSIGPDAKTRRLFENPESVEKEYFIKTGVFPIMHSIGIRVSAAQADPSLVRDIYNAFVASHDLANADLEYEQALKIGLPWLRGDLARVRSIMGDDFWPNGFSRNRKVLETMIDWSFRDGLISKRVEPEELFFSELLDT